MKQVEHQYAIALYAPDHVLLGQFSIDVDWLPAVEWVRFRGIRQGLLAPEMSGGQSVIQPVWHLKIGQPYLAGFRVTVLGKGGGQASADISTSYVQGLARLASSSLVETGQLKVKDRYYYLVMALPRTVETVDPPPAGIRFSVEETPQRLPLRTRSLDKLLRRSLLCGDSDGEDAPVFIPQAILDEACALTRQTGANETGGILIGHLLRDSTSSEIGVEITAQIPALHTNSELTRLTFTSETWASVQAAINLRRKNEMYLGWWHSHAYMKETCKDCERKHQGTCNTSAVFMSSEDRALHRTVFPRAFNVALVISDTPCTGLTWGLFGWRHGMVVPRGFHVLGASSTSVIQESALAAAEGEA